MSKTVQIVMVPLRILAKEQRPKKCEFVILCHDLTFHDFKKPQTQFTEVITQRSYFTYIVIHPCEDLLSYSF